MKPFLITIAAVFLLTFLATPTMGAGWFWDFGNALGFAAVAGLLYLTISSSRRLNVRAHQVLGYAVLFLAALHVFWFLLGDAAVVEFIKPGAPDYMWLGIIGLLLLAALITVALLPDRLHVHKNYPAFKYWHRVLAVSTVACITYHIVFSNFYLAAWYQSTLFVMLVLVVMFGRKFWQKLGESSTVTVPSYLIVSLLFIATFTMLRNMPL